MELESNVLECVKAAALTALQDLELKKTHAASKDALSDEISLLKKSLDKYNRQKFSIYDEYTKGRMTREAMAEKNAGVSRQIEETKRLLDEKMEEIAQQDMCPEDDAETLTVLSLLDVFDADKIRYLVDQVLVHGETEIEIVWNADDFIAQR